LTDGVVVVRQRRTTDLNAIGTPNYDAETRSWFKDVPMGEQDRRTGMARVRQAWRSGTSAPLVIAVGGTDQPADLINLQFHDDDRLQCVSRPPWGIASRAVRLVAEWAFDEVGITGPAVEANTVSIRVAEKCDFQRISSRVWTDVDRGLVTICGGTT
jgi:RimJ/RimL family protein N-acetyltransferase